jgi:signal transduction histidine kinase/DNA-binding response OmpR family regulator
MRHTEQGHNGVLTPPHNEVITYLSIWGASAIGLVCNLAKLNMKNAHAIRANREDGATTNLRDALRRLITRRPSGQFYQRVVVVWLTFSLASVVLAAATWVRLSRQLKAATQAVVIRLEVDSIFELLLEARSSQCGYVATGHPRFLKALQESALSLPGRFEHLNRLAQNDPLLLKGVLDFLGRAEAGLRYQQRVVLARQEQGAAAASSMEAGGEWEERLAALRRDAVALGETPSALVFDQGAVARSQLARASLTSLVAGILGLGAGLLALGLSRLTVQHQERERELIQAKLQADRHNQEKTACLANMTHEIRTPMNAILGFGELLEKDQLNEKQHHYLQFIRRSASSLLQLINDMLDLSKIEAGMLKLHREPTDPREIGQFIQTMFSESALRKHLQLSWKIAEDLPRSLLLDGPRLRQILVNLVGNAVNFTDQGSIAVRLRWEKQVSGPQGTLVIEVEDTGVGIPADRLEMIFHPFVQAGAHPAKEGQGTGLGLAIVKSLAEMMGGSVTAASELARGTLFRLRLPAVALSQGMPATDRWMSAPATNFNSLRPATVLGVDDHETNRQLLRAVLGDSHHRLLLAGSGAEAIALARQFRPDIILLDIRLPGRDGYRVREALRLIPALQPIPVIAMTASNLVAEGSDRQFDGYMGKPFSRQNLFDELARFLPRLPQADAASNQAGLFARERAARRRRRARALHSTVDEGSRPAKAPDLRHDFRSSLAGVVMSGELLLDQIAMVNDTPAALLVTKILAPSRRLLQAVKGGPSRTTSLTGAPPPGEMAEREEWVSLLVDGSKAVVGHMQADARELCRRMARLTPARALQLSENILQGCTDLANLAERGAGQPVAAQRDSKLARLEFPAPCPVWGR